MPLEHAEPYQHELIGRMPSNELCAASEQAHKPPHDLLRTSASRCYQPDQNKYDRVHPDTVHNPDHAPLAVLAIVPLQ